MAIQIRILSPNDLDVLQRIAPDVFDHSIDRTLTTEFLSDPRHHLAVAIDDGTVVGFTSAVHYIHPDKPAELWINEVSVAPTHRRRGIGKQLLSAMFEVARRNGCCESWVLTDRSNAAAMKLYKSAGAEALPRDQVMFTFKL